MQRRITEILFTAICCSPCMAADNLEVNMNPGLWEWTTEMNIPNMPKKMPPHVSKRCFTKDDLVPAGKKPGQKCDIKELKTTKDNVTWAITCSSPQGPVASTGQMFYNGDSAHGEVTINTQGMTMSSKMSGKRLGPCAEKH